MRVIKTENKLDDQKRKIMEDYDFNSEIQKRIEYINSLQNKNKNKIKVTKCGCALNAD